jgi:hypothetical protein
LVKENSEQEAFDPGGRIDVGMLATLELVLVKGRGLICRQRESDAFREDWITDAEVQASGGGIA